MASAPALLAPEQDVPLYPVRNHGLLMLGVMIAALLQILDSTIANVAVPHMQTSLGANADTINWVLTSYIVAAAVAMPITGWLAERVGTRRLFIWSVAGFILSSMLCGMAQNMTSMVIFRAMQGITGSFISPLSQAAMIDSTKPSRQPQMMSLWGMSVMIGPILGPILGGWLTEEWNWRWVFYVNLPLGIVSLVILIAELPDRAKSERRFDLIGFGLVALALGSLQLMLDRGNHVDWFESVEIWIYTAVTVSAAWVGVLHLTSTPDPLFRRELFANPNFAISLLLMVVVGLVMMASIALLPPMMQHLFGYSVIDTGWALMPRGVGTLVSMQVSGWLVRRGVDARPIVMLGFLLAGVSLWMMSGWSLDVDNGHIIITGLIQGLGMGLVFIPLNNAAFATLPPTLRTEGASLLNLTRSLGASVGISVCTTLFARSVQVSHADLAANVDGSFTEAIDVTTIDRFQALGDAVLRMIDGEVTRQAMMIAYINDFYAMMWVTLAAIPLVLLMRPVTPPRQP
ncbi:DHA2 family efflux MFS transporter permease subunit [Novosphingobium arvoryzae]|uniref:EmrB/QacA family drug resistance transporter n=1 Tax=Novosphingobium arvoryzae TaxID=1256514 RepID=A0A918RHT6_9SPHN|nr:DHA2 family efflux MFS transporter permease subunit [Novosphingobium arvoryzae]GGZ96828.1 EmrB/QacA family drug resistance transporter [Novosphingobium arvoryzae]